MKKSLLVAAAIVLSIGVNAQWNQQSLGFNHYGFQPFDVHVVDSNIVWLVGGDVAPTGHPNEFARTLNGGATWNHGQVINDTNANYSSICAINADTAWMTSYDTLPNARGVFKTVDGGITWTQQGAGTIYMGATSWPSFVYFKDANNGFVGGDPDGGFMEIWTTTDGGANWTRTPQANLPSQIATEYSFTNVYSVVGNTVWMGTYTGRVWKSVDFGLHWTATTVSSAANTGIEDVYFADANHGLARVHNRVTNLNTYKKTTNGGSSWTTVMPVGNWFIGDFDGPPNSTVMVTTGVTNTSFIYGSAYSLDYGVTWITIDSNMIRGNQGWANTTTGWSADINIDSVTGGISKFDAPSIYLGVQALNGSDAIMRVYPNPSEGNFTLQIDNAEPQDAVVTIVDVVGNIVYTKKFSNSSSTFIKENIDLTGIANGLYFVNVQNGKTKFSDKLIIQ